MERPTADDLVALNRAATVATLLSGVVHEVNNALLVVAGSAELLESQAASPESVVARAGRIRGQAMRAGGSIAAVLDFARGDTVARARVNLRDVAASAAALRTYAIGRAGLTLSVDSDDERPLMVHGNRMLLLQAVLNLIANAERALASLAGGVIRVELAGEGGRATLRVADTGPGVPDAEQDRIFEPFVTGHASPDVAGLGLPATRRIAEVHGGTLALEPAERGAAFVLSLPLEEGPPSATPRPPG